MDFTNTGAGSASGSPSAEGAPFPSYEPVTRALMSSFAQDPQNGPEPSGPVLVMPPPQKPRRSQLWMQRIWLIVFVLFCLEVGIILIVLPWTRIWADNSLLLGHPQIREFLSLGFVRGLVSGLGLVDIWMGVAEAVRYHETP